MKIFCLYNDGNHLQCFETREEAEDFIAPISSRYLSIEEEESDDVETCDCGGLKPKVHENKKENIK